MTTAAVTFAGLVLLYALTARRLGGMNVSARALAVFTLPVLAYGGAEVVRSTRCCATRSSRSRSPWCPRRP